MSYAGWEGEIRLCAGHTESNTGLTNPVDMVEGKLGVKLKQRVLIYDLTPVFSLVMKIL